MKRQQNTLLLVILWLQTYCLQAFDVTSYLSKYKLEPANEHEDGGGGGGEPDDDDNYDDDAPPLDCPISCHNGGTCAWGPADYSMFPYADTTSGGVNVPFSF